MRELKLNIAKAIANDQDELFDQYWFNRMVDIVYIDWIFTDCSDYYEESEKPVTPSFLFYIDIVMNELESRPNYWKDLVRSYISNIRKAQKEKWKKH